MSFFVCDKVCDDPILSLSIAFAQDKRENKVNLGVGAYKDEKGMPYIFQCVKDAEIDLTKENFNKEYLPIEGDREFIKASLQLILDASFLNQEKYSFFAAQTIGATGALRIGGEFLVRQQIKSIYLSSPTWANHIQIFKEAGLKVKDYPYYDPHNNRLDFNGMIDAICTMPENSCIILQPCCHNPTGIDLNMAEWKELSDTLIKQRVLPFFDLAYMGLKDGIEEDIKVIQYFIEQGHEVLIATSFSKNLGLYGERVGFLTLVTHSKKKAENAASHIKQIIRSNYSTPPIHGAKIVQTILNAPKRKKLWLNELKIIRERIKTMRHEFYKGLSTKFTDIDFQYLLNQSGMFSYSGLTPEQVMQLKDKYAIFLPKSGRINVAGLNQNNLKYVIESICNVLT